MPLVAPTQVKANSITPLKGNTEITKLDETKGCLALYTGSTQTVIATSEVDVSSLELVEMGNNQKQVSS